jgi:hypothetical protein
VDFEGKTIRELQASADPGLHRIVWDLARAPSRPAGEGRGGPFGAGRRGGGAGGGPGRGGAGGQGPGRGGRGPSGPPASPGMYRVVLSVDGQEFAQALRVDADPATNTNLIAPQTGSIRR